MVVPCRGCSKIGTMLKRWISSPVGLARCLLGLLMLVEVAILVAGPDFGAARAEVAEAVRAGKQPQWEPLADTGIHLAAWLNLALAVILFVAAPIWVRPLAQLPETDDHTLTKRTSQRWWVIGLVACFAVVYGWSSFAGKSLWWDETWSVRQCSLGQWKEDAKKPGELVFSPTSWKRCAFYYLKPTNHPTMSLLQKASFTVWNGVTGAPTGHFSDLAARMPSLVASGIAVVLLIRLIGIGRGVILLGGVLAFHPWHLRYGVEARAYALIVPLCLSGILASRKVISTRGRHLWAWVWLAVNQALWIYTYMLAVIDVGIMFLVTAFLLWRSEDTARERWTQMVRLTVVHVFAAMLWMQAFLPNLVQIPHWHEPGNVPQILDGELLRTTFSQLLFGMEWSRDHGAMVETEGLTSLVQQAGSEPVAWVLLIAAGGLSLLGLRTAVVRTPQTGLLLFVPLVSAVILLLLSRFAGMYFYPRFIIALLPVVVAGWALFPQVFSDYVQKRRWVAMAFAAPFIWFTAHQRLVLRTLPYAPLRDVAEFLKAWPEAEGHGKTPVVVCFGLGREALPVYYPQIISTSEAADVAAARDRAKQESRDCLVVLGYPFFNQSALPEGTRLIRDPSQFQELRGWQGIEADFYFRVYRAL